MKFKVEGKIDINDERTFTKIVEADSKEHAKNKAYSILGSHNKVKRKDIQVSEVSEYK